MAGWQAAGDSAPWGRTLMTPTNPQTPGDRALDDTGGAKRKCPRVGSCKVRAPMDRGLHHSLLYTTPMSANLVSSSRHTTNKLAPGTTDARQSSIPCAAASSPPQHTRPQVTMAVACFASMPRDAAANQSSK